MLRGVNELIKKLRIIKSDFAPFIDSRHEKDYFCKHIHA